jgi:Fe-S cluster biogenesis protein NfuA
MNTLTLIKEIELQVEEALNSLRPYLQEDGGDMTLSEITDDYIVKIELHGNCKDCNMRTMTMKAGIEEAVKRAVPQIKQVIAITIDNI